LLGININNTSDVISYDLDFTPNVNSVVISPDGSKVYAAQHNGGSASIAFFDVTSNSLILNRVVILSGGDFLHGVSSSLQMAIKPDGSSLFISQYNDVGFLPLKNTFRPPVSFFRIDLTSDTSTATSIADPDGILRSSRGLVVSPDNKFVYVGTDTNYIVALPVSADSVDASNIIAEDSIPYDNHLGLAIDSAGNKLYVGNQSEGSVSIITVNGMQAYVEGTILDNTDYNGASGLAVSPDGTTLYVAETGSNSVLAVPLNNPGSPLVQDSIAGAFGLGLSPNGSTLYVTQLDDGVDTTTVINAADFMASPSSISIGGISLTIGQFIGP